METAPPVSKDGSSPDLQGPTEVQRAEVPLTAAPVYPIADTTIRAGLPNGNDGAAAIVGVTSASIADVKRTIIRFSNADITARIPGGKVLWSARIDMKVAGISAGWLGGSVDALRMTHDWVEGTGLIGHGASWNCSDDLNTSNLALNCAGANLWSQLPTGPNVRPFFTEATDRARIFTGGLTTVSFNVTSDVQKFLNGSAPNYGWMLAGAANPFGGEWVSFHSRTAALANRPTLVIEYGDDQCLGNPDKGVPGVCGCDIPDRDTNLDGVIDCVDATVTATADTTLKLILPTGNDGKGAFLGATSASVVDLERFLVRMDTAAINTAAAGKPLIKATLELTVAGIALGWAGGTLDVNRMTHNWGEGTGLQGSMPNGGATWTCSNDRNTTLIGNLIPNAIDCAAGNNWGMQWFDIFPRPYVITPTAKTGIIWPGVRTVRFDVTNDVKGFITSPASNFGWMVQGSLSTILSGTYVKFGSRETGAPPRLLLELAPPCPPGVAKVNPGLCGCFTPDTNTDGDTQPDCLDQCPADSGKLKPGVCGCGSSDADSDGDCMPDCIDPCPSSNDTAAGGQCGCPSSPKAAGTECGDGLSDGIEECDGAGHCGDPFAYSPDPSCACKLIRAPEKTYWFCPCTETRTEASNNCQDVDGQDLVEIEGSQENDLIARCLTVSSWTGANDLGPEGDWNWNVEQLGQDTGFWDGNATTGKPHEGNYANWRAGEPNAADCGAISAAATDKGQWFANGCGLPLGYVCEKDRAELDPPPEFTPICMLAGIVCGNDEPTDCTEQDEVFGDFEDMTPDEWRDAAGNCEVDASACVGPLEPPDPGSTCTTLSPDIDETADGVVCSLALADGFNTNTLQRCTDPDDDAECPAGQQCGFAARCTACDPNAGPCPLCYGEQDCPGLDNRCETFLACGTPSCQYFCTNQQPVSVVECRVDGDCTGDDECGWLSRCSDCDPSAGNCPTCNTFTNPDGSLADDCGGAGARCVQYLGCGDGLPGCFRDDPTGNDLCSEVTICGSIEGEETAVIDEEPEELNQLTAQDWPDAEVPNPATSKFEDVPPCSPASECATAADPNRQGFDHPYCHYDVPGQLTDRDTDDAFNPPPNNTAKSSSNKIGFTVTPDLDLAYDVKTGPLGLVYPRASARAEFSATVEVNNLLTITDEFDVIKLIAEIEVGLQQDSDPSDPIDDSLCGVDPGESTVEIFEMDLLPADFVDAIRIPNAEAQEDCLKAVDKFQEAVDRAKKAFFDAQVLLKEYNARKGLMVPKNFPGPTAMNPARLSLCELIVKDPPPLGFPPVTAPATCHTETPEATLNRFITYYNRQLELVSTQAVNEVADALDGLLADAVSGAGGDRYNDGLGFKLPLASLHDVEEINVVNQTFFVGPIPCLLQVMFIVEYGLNIDATVALRVGESIRQALAPVPTGQEKPIAEGGIDGTPYGQAGIGLFVGVGFDIGVASASMGIQGTLNLGRISLPVHAGAGVMVSAIGDDRAVTMPLPAYITDLVTSGNLQPSQVAIPIRKFAFELGFRYGADVTLSNVLSGSIDLRVRVKFLFFSKTWRKNIVRFNGLPSRTYHLFVGGASLDRADWGTVEMPMPFFQLTHIRGTVPVTDDAPAFTHFPHEQFLFDSQCSCIPDFADVPVDDQDDLRECARKEDCCNQDADHTCFKDPQLAGSKGVCTDRREIGTFGQPPFMGGPGVRARLGESCVEDEDCVVGGNCLGPAAANTITDFAGPAIGVPVTFGVCMPISSCFGGPCTEDADCGFDNTTVPNECGADLECDTMCPPVP